MPLDAVLNDVRPVARLAQVTVHLPHYRFAAVPEWVEIESPDEMKSR